MNEQTDFNFNSNAKPGKRLKLSNYCLSCSDPIPSNKNFCCEECENEFYRESELEVDKEEVKAEMEELRREEGKLKAGLFEEVK